MSIYMADIKIGLPLGTVALAAALVIKVFRNSEEVNRSYRMASILVLVGTLLNTVGYLFVMEAPGEEYSAAKSRFWQILVSWRSNTNPELAAVTFYITIALLFVLLVTACIKGFRLSSPVSQKVNGASAPVAPGEFADSEVAGHVQA